MKYDEHNIQVLFVKWFRLKHKKHFVFAIPNGEYRTSIAGSRLKKEGVVSGIPDLQVLLSNGKSFFIEMKTIRGKTSIVQKERIKDIERLHHTVLVGYGLDDAISKTNDHINEIVNLQPKKTKTVDKKALEIAQKEFF